MTPEDTRKMIEDTLGVWYKATEQRETMILKSLDRIDTHLEKLNGKVADHERTILENLPHGIQHCVLAEPMQEIKNAMIKRAAKEESTAEAGTHKQAAFNNWSSVINTILVLAGLALTYYLSHKADKELNTKIDNFGTPVIIDTRTGEFSRLREGDSLKFFRDGEFKSTYKDEDTTKVKEERR